MNLELERFIERCRRIDFRNRNELLEGIKSGEIILSSLKSNSDLPCRHFLDIYEHREKHLRRFQTQHSERLRKDVLEMINEMSQTPDERVELWIFTRQPNIIFSVFENTNRRKILGCLKAVDKRLTSEDEWNELWGKPKTVV